MPCFARDVVLAAVLVAGAVPVMAADNPAGPSAAAAAKDAPVHRESVAERITSLHHSLKITAGEEVDWGGVTKAMRDNAAELAGLLAARDARDPATMTVVDDLTGYQAFARAHAEGLTQAFPILYAEMPAAQKKIADSVFQPAGTRTARHA
jgi:hypothetical protein